MNNIIEEKQKGTPIIKVLTALLFAYHGFSPWNCRISWALIYFRFNIPFLKYIKIL